MEYPPSFVKKLVEEILSLTDPDLSPCMLSIATGGIAHINKHISLDYGRELILRWIPQKEDLSTKGVPSCCHPRISW